MKIAIVGSGQVGSTAAYSLLLQGIGSELLLIDQRSELAAAQAMDMLHATPFSHPVVVRHGDYSDLVGCALVVLAAGVNQQPGETRLALLQKNAQIFASIIPEVVRYAGQAILIVATNPLDIMTQLADRLAQTAGLAAGRVLGTGTMLDTARFRSLLGQRYGVAPGSVHAYVLGEHGDSEVLAWSCASVAGVPLAQFAAACAQPLNAEIEQEIERAVRGAAYQIIAGKGATYYGIGAAIASLCRCILYDERSVLTSCAVVDEVAGVRDVALSLPHVIGREGILRTLKPNLNEAEQTALHRSATVIATHLASLNA